MSTTQFPPDFLWGVATSAYQIEGTTTADGRGMSTWDVFSASPGAIRDGSSGARACDHYHRMPQDVGLLRELGVGAYRFSFAWPRIQPAGSGAVNPAGLAFYDRLVDELCANGIAPVATLYHWDTPVPIEAAGGWMLRDTARRFADYASKVAEKFADRVTMWVPINEPAVTTLYGYALGEYAPGRQLLFNAMHTAHHQNLAHGLAVQALRAAGASSIGTANNHGPIWSASEQPEDVAAAEIVADLVNWQFADPVLLGTYPHSVQAFLPDDFLDDLPLIAQPLDFYGVNYYSPQVIAACISEENPLPFTISQPTGYPHTVTDLSVVPSGLTEFLLALRDRVGANQLPPVYLTENGFADAHQVDSAGDVPDTDRVEFLTSHLKAVISAREDDVDVRGYFHWSLLDNFEWTYGYTARFGLVHVDFDTQKRTPKASFHVYKSIIDGAEL
jgi:beta-glucosidase